MGEGRWASTAEPAGPSGSGIAAHCANAGIPVILLDIVPPKLSDADKKSKAARDGFAAGAMQKLQKGKPESDKEKMAVDFLRNDAQARKAFLDKIAAPVLNKMFECGMIP